MPILYPEVQKNDARRIILAIRRLKSQRYNHEISRAKFLSQYEILRYALNETEEYKELRRKVIARAKGICEKCREVLGDQMCHKAGVSFRPDLALRMDNVYWGCQPCHQKDHPDLQLSR
jgi:hypothetical protein